MLQDMNSKNTTKSCPTCGNLLLINAKFCSECGYRFSQSKEKRILIGNNMTEEDVAEMKKQIARERDDYGGVEKSKQEYYKDSTAKQRQIENIPPNNGKPIKVYLTMIIWMTIGILGSVFFMSLIYSPKHIIGWNIFAFIFMIVWIGIGFAVSECSGKKYGRYPIGGYYVFSAVISIGVIIFDIIFFSKIVKQLGGAVGFYFMAIGISMCIFEILVFYGKALKKNYCLYCGLANLFHFSKIKKQTQVCKDKIETKPKHIEKTEIAYKTPGQWGYTRYEIKYTVPKQEVNLGLHRYTYTDDEYVCIKCGRKQIRKRTDVTKA